MPRATPTPPPPNPPHPTLPPPTPPPPHPPPGDPKVPRAYGDAVLLLRVPRVQGGLPPVRLTLLHRRRRGKSPRTRAHTQVSSQVSSHEARHTQVSAQVSAHKSPLPHQRVPICRTPCILALSPHSFSSPCLLTLSPHSFSLSFSLSPSPLYREMMRTNSPYSNSYMLL